MKIAPGPPAFLSNYEILQHFLEVKQANDQLQAFLADRQARQTAQGKKDFPVAEDGVEPPAEEFPVLSTAEEEAEDDADRRGISTDLVWVQEKVLRYLCADYNPTSRQTEKGVEGLAVELQEHHLRKGEVLQIVNLAPTTPVELFCILEDSESRFPDVSASLAAIGQQVAETLEECAPPHLAPYIPASEPAEEARQPGGIEEEELNARESVNGEMQDGSEFVHEAAWGRDHEDAVDDEEDDKGME